MLCSICKKEIRYDLSFSDLFIFKFICSNCHELLLPKFEVIPLDYGYELFNYYFVKEEDYSYINEEFFYPKIMDIIFNNKDKLIIFYDENIIDLLPFLNFKKDIIFLSYSYIDLALILEDNME